MAASRHCALPFESFLRIVGLALLISITAMAAVGQDLSNLGTLGQQALHRGDYDEAERYFRLELKRAESTSAPELELVLAMADLAETLRSRGQYDEAERLFDRSLRILQTGPAATDRLLAVILSRSAASLNDDNAIQAENRGSWCHE
jgi:tetratricopeptide (TPR) repeat protein